MSTFQILHQSRRSRAALTRHVPGPKLFSGPAWATGIPALSTGGGTTPNVPCLERSRRRKSGRGKIGMWTCLESGFSSAFSCCVHIIISWIRRQHQAPRNLCLRHVPLNSLPRGGRGRTYGGSLWGKSSRPRGLCEPSFHVGSPGKLPSNPGGRQVSKMKCFGDSRLGVKEKATRHSFPPAPPSSQPLAPFGGGRQGRPLGAACLGSQCLPVEFPGGHSSLAPGSPSLQGPSALRPAHPGCAPNPRWEESDPGGPQTSNGHPLDAS